MLGTAWDDDHLAGAEGHFGVIAKFDVELAFDDEEEFIGIRRGWCQ